MDYSAMKILVLGMGDSGFSAACWLKAAGSQVQACDSRGNPPRLADFAAQRIPAATGAFVSPAGFDMLVISPGLSLAEPVVLEAKSMGIPVVGDVEIFARESRKWQPQVVAITGSNGKSTVTEMVGAMCRACGKKTVVAGNIGLPVLDTLESRAEIYVLELSSFQLETLHSLDASVATVLNVSQDHLDRYASMDDYAAAKARVFQGKGAMLLNRDDARSLAMKIPGRKTITFGADSPRCADDYGLINDGGAVFLARGSEKLLAAAELKVSAVHNYCNALAAIAMCSELQLPQAQCLRALREFRGLPHRMQQVAEIDAIEFYDDSKGTNVGATVAALSGVRGQAVVILGGEGKGQDFSPLRSVAAQKARAVVLIGRDGQLIADSLEGSGAPLSYARDMEEAVNMAFEFAVPGDAVLLSPACASFDMFKNYVHRAECFVAAVKKLQESRHAL